ncbi:MAG: hypothetical protein KGH79_05170 [Patescibacteria group bacterium]|nr:hypothetical protein [Patescibacteria group bacterium]
MNGNNNAVAWIIGIIVVLVIVLGGWWLISQQSASTIAPGTGTMPATQTNTPGETGATGSGTNTTTTY